MLFAKDRQEQAATVCWSVCSDTAYCAGKPNFVVHQGPIWRQGMTGYGRVMEGS